MKLFVGRINRWVNLGSQKNFARYAARIGNEWEKSSDTFNEFYFKRAVARGLVFRATERIVSAQPWYNGGYRANIVAYSLAVLGSITKSRKESIDFLGIWNAQKVDTVLEGAIALVSGVVNDDITNPPHGISNISEWCKREACWTRIQARIGEVEKLLSPEFYDRLLTLDDQGVEIRSARKTQKVDDGIEAQRQVLAVPASEWARIHQALLNRSLLTPKEDGVLKIAMQIPAKLPTEKQCVVLLDVLERGRAEGIRIGGADGL